MSESIFRAKPSRKIFLLPLTFWLCYTGYIFIMVELHLQKTIYTARPLVEEFFEWLTNLGALPKTPLGIASNYALKQRKYLERYLLDGRLEISNNRAERSIKPFVIDRKNFLFANTPRGAKASAIMFSIIETAKENGLDPFKYLSYVFKNAPNWDIRNNLNCLEFVIPTRIPDSTKACLI